MSLETGAVRNNGRVCRGSTTRRSKVLTQCMDTISEPHSAVSQLLCSIEQHAVVAKAKASNADKQVGARSVHDADAFQEITVHLSSAALVSESQRGGATGTAYARIA